MSKSYDIDYLLEEVITLPSLPSTVHKLNELLDDPDSSLSEIGKIISTDPSLALKTLRLVNSAYYGLREKVTSVEHAVTLLGAKVIKNMVVTAAVFDAIQTNEVELLHHSVSCAFVTRTLIKTGATPKVTVGNPEEAFVYGLLHDIGKIIFQEYMAEDYKEVSRLVKEEKVPDFQAEQRVIGVDHAEVGARLAQWWKLSPELAEAIHGHHELDRCANEEFKSHAALIAIGDYICYAVGMSDPEDVAPNLGEEIWRLTGLTSANVVPALDEIFESTDQIEELVRLAA